MNIKPWRADLKRWLELPPQIVDGKVISTSRHHQVQALDSETGEVLWKTDCSDQFLESPKVVGEDTLIVQGKEGKQGSIYGLDLNTGEQRWSQTFAPSWKFHEQAMPNGSVLLRRSDLTGEESEPMLKAISPQTGETIWSASSETKKWGIPVVDSQNRVFVEVRAGRDESMLALDGNTGEQLWQHQGTVWGQPRVVSDDRLLLASRDSITVLDSTSGEVTWTNERNFTKEPWILGDTVVGATSRTDSAPGTRLVGMDSKTGEEKWHYDTPYLTAVAQGPEGQMIHHGFKVDANGQRKAYIHALDTQEGAGLWSIDLGEAVPGDIGVDSEGRVTLELDNGKGTELVVIKDGEILWRQSVQGDRMAVAGTGDSMAIFDRQGITVVDADTGEYQEQLTLNATLTNYDGQVGPDGRLLVSGIDGEIAGMTLEGAQSILGATSKTPGSMRHYRYTFGETSDGFIYADVEEDGKFVRGADALFLKAGVQPGDKKVAPDKSRVTAEELAKWDGDNDGYLSRVEMNRAEISLWWDRDRDGEVGRRDGLVAMAGEGHRQAVVDLDNSKLEVRTRPIGS